MGILTRLRAWGRWKITSRLRSVADVPERLPQRHAILVGGIDFDKWLVFECPCRRGHRVVLNLDLGRWPSWRIASAIPLTIQPSVDEESSVGRCHYFVRKGRVRWIERTNK
ncbi:MAG: hypothetical protein J0G30_04270 [Actinomycetales bacterium]|nr:hypothetical protein [Actinomycetales bacterium]